MDCWPRSCTYSCCPATPHLPVAFCDEDALLDSGSNHMYALQIERYLKQAVVDKSAVVASAVLVSGLHLLENNAEIVKRWTNEVQEAVQSKHSMVQFHAVALLHALRKNDRLAISKLVSSLTRGNVRSPLAQCLLVRYVSEVIADSQVRCHRSLAAHAILPALLMRHMRMLTELMFLPII